MPTEHIAGKPTTRRYSREGKQAAVRMVRSLQAETRRARVDVGRDQTRHLMRYAGIQEDPPDHTQAYWEKMTRLRLQSLTEPEPGATVVRVSGLMYDGFLIEAEAVAYVGCGDEDTRESTI